MTAAQAWDQLADEGFLKVNEAGWGRIVKAPKVTAGPRGHRELDWFVSCVKALGAYSVDIGPGSHHTLVEVNTGGDADALVFRFPARRAGR